MKRHLLLLIMCIVALSVTAQEADTLKFRIQLTDKQGTKYAIKKPEKFLSAKAIERRQRQGLAIDESDLPVSEKYLKAIRKAGLRILQTSKWNNAVLVSTNDTTLIARIAQEPFVQSTRLVWQQPKSKAVRIRRDSVTNKVRTLDNVYGTAWQQVSVSKAEKLHEAGFKGQGMTIAVIDGGFQNVDRVEAMNNIHIIGTRDFVTPGGNVYEQPSHGMMVLSCIGMNKPHVMIGTAPEASFWLLCSEDSRSEQPVEEDYWAAAVEFADSVGVDVINTSLGYFDFDNDADNYELRHLDGKTAFITRAAARLADKGIVLVCSAGNSGQDSWKKISPPADAPGVLTVGAIAKNKKLAPFSSVGTTADGRIKPDVMAIGLPADVMAPNGENSMSAGTSFSAPIMCGMVACLWQARPELTARQLMELVKSSGDRADYPDNIFGFGIPDMWKAYQTPYAQ